MSQPDYKIGTSVRRKEDVRLVTGKGNYIDDEMRPSQTYAYFLRSPHAHAKIEYIEADVARSIPGVIAVITGEELRSRGIDRMPSGWQIKQYDGSPMVDPPHYSLACERVRHVGDPVAVIIAESVNIAKDASEQIAIDYKPLPVISSSITAVATDAPFIWSDAPTNICADWRIGDAKSVEEAFAVADHVVSYNLTNNRLVQNPLEPRGALAEYYESDESFTLTIASQNTHAIRTGLSAYLGIPEHSLKVLTNDVGGGFGAKIPLYPEECVITWVAREICRPVKWTGERTDGFQTDAQARDHVTDAELAIDDEGKILGLRVDTLANVGAYLYGGSAAIPTHYYGPLLSGPYIIPAISARVRLTFTNTVTLDAYRGAGRPEATYVLERLMDRAAAQIGMDRVEFRKRNLIPSDAFPYKTPVGMEYDIGDHFATLDRALKLSNWATFESRRASALSEKKYRGIGLSTYVEVAGGLPSEKMAEIGGGSRAESALVRVHPSGAVSVYSGSQSTGQGHETAFAQIVSSQLSVPIDSVKIIQGNTDIVPFGRGTAASRSLVIGGSAIFESVTKVLQKSKLIAARLLEADPAKIEFEDGVFYLIGTNRSHTFAEIAREAYSGRTRVSEEIEIGLEATTYYDPKGWTFPGGCHICEVEIDPETGVVELVQIVAVDDVGRVVNPMIVEGQIQGGLAQGIGQAIYENCIYDTDGQLVTGSFMDYCMPRADDLPFFTVDFENTLSAHNPLGAKGCAEVGTVGVPPAVINAVVNALAPLGVRDISMPATPSRVWEAIQSAKLNDNIS
jgi:carbon-monoxide dehydrogenase large subunit